MTQQPDDRGGSGPLESAVISVRGEAILEVDPEIARLTVTVSAQARDRREAFERLAKRNDELLALVRSYGDSVERLESGGVAVAPELRRGGKDEKIRSYHGSVRVTAVVADFTILGELVGRLSELETAAVSGPWWQLRPNSPVYREARTQAVGEALVRARDYAGALGCRINGLIELADTGLSTTNAQPPAPAMARRSFASPASVVGASYEQPELDLEPQRQTVRADVEARFSSTQPHLAS